MSKFLPRRVARKILNSSNDMSPETSGNLLSQAVVTEVLPTSELKDPSPDLSGTATARGLDYGTRTPADDGDIVSQTI